MTYRAALLDSLDGPGSLRIGDVERPPLAPEDIRIRVHAAGVNFPDLLMTRGLYQRKPPLPFSPGMEVAGTVLECGTKVSHLHPGDSVMAMTMGGGFAQELVVSGRAALPKPESLDFAEAATFGVAGITAHYGLLDRGRLTAGETVLVSGASGGVGLAGVQLAKAVGATVIALARGADKRAAAKSAGADQVLDYTSETLREDILAANGGRKVDLVYDPVGGPLATTLLRTLGWAGRYVIAGFAAGDIQSVPANQILIRNIDMMGVRAGEAYTRDPGLAAGAFKTLLHHARAGRLRPHVSRRLPLEEASAALLALEARNAVGRIALVMDTAETAA